MEEMKNEVTQEVTEVQEDAYKSGSVQYIDSREVAEMVGKNHKDLIRDIRRYCQYLEKGKVDFNQRKIAPIDFFAEASYQDAKGEKRPCYLVTQKGCEFIAHKLTGEKGSVFTATYINRFHEMEDELAGGSGSVDALADTVKEYMLCQEKRNDEQVEFMRRQIELNQMFMEHMANLEKGKTGYRDNPYCIIEESKIESRKKEIYDLTSKVAELCSISQTKILHYMYRTLEEDLGIVLDSYKAVYRRETGRQDAGMVEAIASNEQIYEKAVEMNQSVIERKQIFG